MSIHAPVTATILALAAVRVGATPDAAPDWVDAVTLEESAVQLWPAAGAVVRQSPPDFHWPSPSARARFVVTLQYPGGRCMTRETDRNWLNWDERLPPGEYRWAIAIRTGDGLRKSKVRRFMVAPGAAPFVVPSTATLVDRARNQVRPRSLPPHAALAATLRQRRRGVELLTARVLSAAGESRPTDPGAASTQSQLNADVRRAQEALVAWVATRELRFLDIALAWTDRLAAWDPGGRTSYRRSDQLARGITATLVLAFDWLDGELGETRRKRLLAAIEARLAPMQADLFTRDERLSRYPYDSHRNHTLTIFAALSAIMAGELPEATDWLAQSVPMALHWTSPWGGEDGGFANGTAYAQWVTSDMLFAWQVLRLTLDVDLGNKAWVRNYARFLAYFLPPGTPAGAFGDGAERRLDEQWARFGRAYASFAPSPLARWYASHLEDGDYSRLEMLLAPPIDLDHPSLPESVGGGATFPAIGWSAMHSSLTDRDRTSVYFKSSPYGSFNHSHADQLSFVIRSGGERLAIDSGYYDDYDSPHWRQWYKQTRAHNAVTYDGGRGQRVFETDRGLGRGRIVRFEHRDTYDLVTGDAADAYGPAMVEATRTLVYLRPDALLLHDRLRSTELHRWEWNLHALERMHPVDKRRVRIEAGDASLCVRLLDAPPVSFRQDNDFIAAPRGRQRASQWHGAFVTEARSRHFALLALLEVGCRSRPATVLFRNAELEVNVAGYTVHFGTKTNVQPPAAPVAAASCRGFNAAEEACARVADNAVRAAPACAAGTRSTAPRECARTARCPGPGC